MMFNHITQLQFPNGFLTTTWIAAWINNSLMILPSWTGGLMITTKRVAVKVPCDHLLTSCTDEWFVAPPPQAVLCVRLRVSAYVWVTTMRPLNESLWGNKPFHFKCNSYDANSQDHWCASTSHGTCFLSCISGAEVLWGGTYQWLINQCRLIHSMRRDSVLLLCCFTGPFLFLNLLVCGAVALVSKVHTCTWPHTSRHLWYDLWQTRMWDSIRHSRCCMR